jgi:hypothetical protein
VLAAAGAFRASKVCGGVALAEMPAKTTVHIKKILLIPGATYEQIG